MCVYSPRYPVCNAHAPYCHLWPARALQYFFPHFLINGTIFEGGKNTQISNFMKIRTVGDGGVPRVQTDRHDEADCRLSQILRTRLKTDGLLAHSIKPALKAIFQAPSRSKLPTFVLKSDSIIFPVTEGMKGGLSGSTKKCMVLPL